MAPVNHQAASASADPAGDDGAGRRLHPALPAAARGSHTLPKLFIGVCCAAVAYAVYQRAGTSANADTVIAFENFAGGFAAVGRTADQPGFLLFSELPASDVRIESLVYANWLGGRWTVVLIHTPAESLRVRLRGPRVFLVSADGEIHSESVAWSAAQWREIEDGMDCEHAVAGKTLRCGEPFADAADVVRTWPTNTVPSAVRAFLQRYAGE